MDVVEKLKQRAEEIPQEVADRENEASSHCGPYGTETAADYMDDYDRLLMLEAATELTALRARVAQLEGDNARLREDFKKALSVEVMAHCESCHAPLFEGEDWVSDPDCVYGCWHSMTDIKSKRDRPCFAYRVGKPDARQALGGSDGR